MRKLIQDYPIFFSCFMFLVMSMIGIAVFIGFTGLIFVAGMGKLADAIEEQENKNSGIETIYGNSSATDKILVLNIKGIILNEELNDPITTFLMDISYGDEIRSILRDTADDSTVKGVVLNIDSPGGTITGSRAIYDAVKKYKTTTGNPVLSYVSGLGASGAYMSAIAGDEIMMDYGTMVGSVGVIFGPFKEYTNVVSEADGVYSVSAESIEAYNFTAGANKDFGFPFEPMAQEVKDQIQAELDAEYASFVSLVTSEREISPKTLENDIKALLYGPDSAVRLGLADKIGNKPQAFARIAELTGISTDNLNYYSAGQKSFWETLFEESVQRVNQPTARPTCVLCNQMLYLHGDPQTYEPR